MVLATGFFQRCFYQVEKVLFFFLDLYDWFFLNWNSSCAFYFLNTLLNSYKYSYAFFSGIQLSYLEIVWLYVSFASWEQRNL